MFKTGPICQHGSDFLDLPNRFISPVYLLKISVGTPSKAIVEPIDIPDLDSKFRLEDFDTSNVCLGRDAEHEFDTSHANNKVCKCNIFAYRYWNYYYYYLSLSSTTTTATNTTTTTTNRIIIYFLLVLYCIWLVYSLICSANKNVTTKSLVWLHCHTLGPCKWDYWFCHGHHILSNIPHCTEYWNRSFKQRYLDFFFFLLFLSSLCEISRCINYLHLLFACPAA